MINLYFYNSLVSCIYLKKLYYNENIINLNIYHNEDNNNKIVNNFFLLFFNIIIIII